MDQHRDQDLDAHWMRGTAYLLGLLAATCWIVFAVMLGDETRVPSAAPWLWMAGAVSLTVFSAACAVMTAVKAMESRLRAGSRDSA